MRNAQFRFCRDERCGIADDELTNGISAQGFLLAAENDFPGNIDYTIEKWAWQEAYTYPIPQVEFNSQNNILIKGFFLYRRLSNELVTVYSIGDDRCGSCRCKLDHYFTRVDF